MTSLTDQVKDKVSKLTATFDTLEVQRRVWKDGFDQSIVHESTGVYVTKSTEGFFANEKSPAFICCRLVGKALLLLEGTKEEKEKLRGEMEKQFETAMVKGFVSPYSYKDHAKREGFCELRKDAKVADYEKLVDSINNLGFDIIDQGRAEKSKLKEKVGEIIVSLTFIASNRPEVPRPGRRVTEAQKQNMEVDSNNLAYARQLLSTLLGVKALSAYFK